MIAVTMGIVVPLLCGMVLLVLGVVECVNSKGYAIGIQIAGRRYTADPPGILPIAIPQLLLGLGLLVVGTHNLIAYVF